MTLRRSFWHSVETLNHVVYFAPTRGERYGAIGLKGQWMGYFATRAAALGSPPPEVVIATFHGFAPRLVHRAIPDAWDLAERDAILAARYAAAEDVAGPGVADSGIDVRRVADVLAEALPGLDLSSRPLAAGHVGLPRPNDDFGALWHGASALREYRGDSHLIVLADRGLNGVDANVLAVAAHLTFPNQQELRGWTDDEWAAGADRLRERGWLDADGAITADGIAARTAIEDDTDRVTHGGISADAVDLLASVADDLKAASMAVVARGDDPTVAMKG